MKKSSKFKYSLPLLLMAMSSVNQVLCSSDFKTTVCRDTPSPLAISRTTRRTSEAGQSRRSVLQVSMQIGLEDIACSRCGSLPR